MNTQYTRKSPLVLIAAASLMVGATSSAMAAEPIGVTVNGSAISFGGTPPTEVNGSVLVPLRGVFEALGASVDYNVYSHTINAKRGESTIVLPVGSTTATVNGQSQTLSQPAQVINGTTLVPLRFVAQALGAYVDWNAATSTVSIKTASTEANNPPPPHHTDPPPVAHDSPSLSGELTGIYANTIPERVSIRIHGQDEFVPLTKNARIFRSSVGSGQREVDLNALHPGMNIVVDRQGDGAATRIIATYSSIHSTVRSKGRLANGNRVLTFMDGTTVEIAPEATISQKGTEMQFNDIKDGSKVAVAFNPTTNVAYAITILQ